MRLVFYCGALVRRFGWGRTGAFSLELPPEVEFEPLVARADIKGFWCEFDYRVDYVAPSGDSPSVLRAPEVTMRASEPPH